FSISTYNKIWTDAQKDLDIQLQMEREQFLQPEKDRVKVFKMLASSYIKYMRIFRNLEEAHDGLVHQQKRAAIRQVLDGVIGRILEMKKEMVALENSEFHYIDNILEDLKLLPVDIEIPIPRYFIKENLEVLQQREKMLDEILCEAGLQTQAMTFEEAVKMIQVAERARQGRRRAVFMKQMYLEEKRKRQTKLQVQTGPNPDDAATRIQKVRSLISSQMHAKQINAQQGEVHERNEEVFIKDKLRETEGLDIKETLEDQIGQCFIECRHIIGRFPDYPTKEAGGSATIFSEKTPEQVLFFFFVPPEAVGEIDGFYNFFPLSSFFWITAVWQNRDEGWDLLQDHDLELIKEEKREEDTNNVHCLCIFLCSCKNWPWHRPYLLPDSLLSVLCFNACLAEQAFVWCGGKNRRLKDSTLYAWTGEYSYLGTTLRQVDIEPVPSLADVRQLIALYGILPLGSQTVHEKAPLVKALLLAGPAGVGKKMLVDAICTETGANLFNLSASNIAGKYPGKSGLQMMLHMVLKVAKQLQPSVVWIGETEKTFYKSVPKAEEQISPKRLEKILPKFLKALKAQDRVLLVGTTRRPFDANLKPFCKVYQKIIMIPRPDYASRFVLWKHIIQQNGGVITNLLNISCLAKVSDGFTQGHIVQVVRAVLSELRLLQMPRKPLRTAEFMTPLARQDPVYREEEETFKVTLRAMLTGHKVMHLKYTGIILERDTFSTCSSVIIILP
uniref:IQ motif containing with AAA domain 1 n=1 Tax=Anas zonorhyncha TaxID=75864 RepID=A0A8B9ZZ38_9AVES